MYFPFTLQCGGFIKMKALEQWILSGYLNNIVISYIVYSRIIPLNFKRGTNSLINYWLLNKNNTISSIIWSEIHQSGLSHIKM